MSVDQSVPRSTYRLQLRSGFGFREVARLSPYLARLGVSHVYLSPCLQAAPGSTHGYDVVDHGRVSEDLGGPRGFAGMCGDLREHGLGLVVDVVPNHMSIGSPGLNPWWWDVLENGPSSLYAGYFDVDWEHPDPRLRNRVLVPILADHYGRVLKGGGIRLERSGSDFRIAVDENVLPVAPMSLARPLAGAARRCGSEDLGFVADSLAALPAPTVTDAASRQRRHRDKAAIGRFLARILEDDPTAARAVDEELEELRDPASLHDLLEEQNYRLAHWKSAGHNLDYRRFFDINELAALRVEDAGVFEATHRLVLEWAADGTVDGLRIDHPDGLLDPRGYFERLRSAAPRAWIIAEKILEREETLPPDWTVDGTTGYDFLGLLCGLFVDPAAEEALTAFHARFTGDPRDFETVAREKKRLALRELLGSDLNRLTATATRVCEAHLEHRDFAPEELRGALEAVIVRLPVYRTYVTPGEAAAGRDRRILETAVTRAAKDRPDLDGRLFAFLLEILSGMHPGEAEADLVGRFQQLSGPAMAKGLEDTAFYCHHRLICLNEVGASPSSFSTSPGEFHRHCRRILEHHPRTMNATSTHDTKRSEDVRIRIALISEIPAEWTAAVTVWARHNRRHRDGESPPEPAVEYLLYQTLVGAWPIDEDRLLAYMRKAVREAKVHTSWTRPDERYEKAVERFCARVIRDDRFIGMLETFLEPLHTPARTHALSQVLLKLCAPGVPDLYQGNELWDRSLTDPDNRRPVDFGARRRMLEEIEGMEPGEVLAGAEAGLPKLWVTHRALGLGRDRPDALGSRGDYRPLEASGPHAHRVVAFVRGEEVVAVAPRLTLGLRSWEGTCLSLPPGAWRNVLSGEDGLRGTIALEELLARFPVALLERSARGPDQRPR